MSEIPTPRVPRNQAFLAGVGLFAFALVVRSIGLTWGLPNAERWYSYHPDESTRQMVGALIAMFREGGFNPHFFNYPSLSIYATWLIYQVLAVAGLTTSAPDAQYPWPLIRDIIFAGRLFSLMCGAGAAVLTWGIARRLGLRGGAMVAGILAALAPGHVQHSHFATVDVPATFFALLCVWLTLGAKSARGLLGAAFVAGLAAGTKYNVGLVLVVPLVALWTSDAWWNVESSREGTKPAISRRILLSLASIVASLVAFVLSTPYALLDFPAFWGQGENGFYFEAFVHPKLGSGDLFQGTGNGWWYHFSFNLPFVLTWPLVVAALIGIGFAMRAKNRAWWPILAFVGMFFFSLGFSQVRFMRYLLPLAPLLCLFAAYAASRLPKPALCAGVVCLFALLGTVDVTMPFVREDSRDVAARFITGRFTRVGLMNNPWFYTPPFQPEGDNMPPRVPHPIAGVIAGQTMFFAGKHHTGERKAFVISEFETREDLRLHPNGETAQFLKFLSASGQTVSRYKNRTALLPGREFVPHDYLYTSPETSVYYNGLP